MLALLAVSFGLVFIRALAMVLSSPVLGEPEIPRRLHVLFSLLLAAAMFPWARIDTGSLRLDAVMLGLAGLREFAIGASLGTVLAVMYSSFRLAGQAAGQTMGIAIANVVDPLRDEQFSLVGEFWYFSALAVFVAAGGPAYLVEALEKTFQAAPVGRLSVNPQGLLLVGMEAMRAMFELAARLALPVIGVVVLTVWGMGLLGRMIPQMHVFLVGFPLMLLGGLVGLYLAMPAAATLSDEVMREADRLWRGIAASF